MNIGVLGYVGSHNTGIGRYVDNLLERWEQPLRARGHTLTLFANADSPLRVAKAPWIHHCTIPVPASSSIKNLVWAVARSGRTYRSAGIDVLFQPNFTWTPRLRIPVVSTIHDVIEFKVPGKFHPVRTLYRHRAVPRMAALSKEVLTVSETSRRDIVELFRTPAERVVAIPNGVSPEFHPRQAARYQDLLAPLGIARDYVLFVGTLDHPGKNAASLLRAFASVRESLTEGTQVVLAGKPGKGYDDLMAIARAAGLDMSSPHARWLGFVDDAVLPALYASARVFVFPSLYEGFGLPIVEAMAAGTPVITSNIGALAEVGGHAATLVSPLDVSAIASAILRLFQPAAATAARDAGLDHVRQYDWDRSAAVTLEHVLGAAAAGRQALG